MIGVERYAYRRWKPNVRGAFGIGVHDSLDQARSFFQRLHNTIVREIWATCAWTERPISFDERQAAF